MATTSSYNATQSKPPAAPRIVFSLKAWFMCWAYVDLCPVEISWMGRIIQQHDAKGMYYYIDEVFLLKQECGPAETTLDAVEYARLISTLPPEDMNRIRFWGHSHVNMGVYWSGTDIAAMKQLRGGGVNIYIVFNKKGEIRACFDVCDGPHDYTLDDIKTVTYEKKDLAEVIAEVSDGLAEKLDMDPEAVYKLLNRFAREANVVVDDDGSTIPDDIMAEAKAQVAENVTQKTYYTGYSKKSYTAPAKGKGRYEDEDEEWLRQYSANLTPYERARFEDTAWNGRETLPAATQAAADVRKSAKDTRTGRLPLK